MKGLIWMCWNTSYICIKHDFKELIQGNRDYKSKETSSYETTKIKTTSHLLAFRLKLVVCEFIDLCTIASWYA